MTQILAAITVSDEEERRSVLVVEDETFVRWAVSEALREAGYQVIEAVDGTEALSILQTGLALDLVFSDVRMPGAVDGLALLDYVRKSRPHLPVLITSGHCEEGAVIERGARGFLRKPYEIARLVDLIGAEVGEAA